MPLNLLLPQHYARVHPFGVVGSGRPAKMPLTLARPSQPRQPLNARLVRRKLRARGYDDEAGRVVEVAPGYRGPID